MAEARESRRRDATLNRERLLAAAGATFAESGVNAPLDAIARRAGVSIGTLYNHFPTRAALLDAIYPERVAALTEAARASSAEADSWRAFRGFLIQIFELQSTDRGLNDAMTQRYPNTPALSAACERGFADVAGLLDRARAEGTLRDDFGMADLALLIWATSRMIMATVDVAPDAWRRYLDLQLDGLRSAAAHPLPVPPMTAEQVAAAMRGGQ
ncbi:TetR family transcriptional regulator [Parafrankia soli]|uniref:TetR family transcriptional regulator n=1 Tax=Parafrankia soli TaxID=2599596 RepID=A0A1S1Q253_9ACTN|nr:helix-turn-helix domain-containing protein [Parafrankia soli]OHV27676.1 TetR family transcriptional regulator [Parafrankia soli]